MPKNSKQKQKPAAMSLTLMVDGVPMLAIQQQEKVPVTQRTFKARCVVHPGARPSACALTLVETAMFLMQGHPFYEDLFDELKARLLIADTTWGTWAEETYKKNDDAPF